MLVYQSWVGFNAPNGARLRFGRQYSTDLAPVSLFDGALLGVERKRFGVGAFVGTQPDAGDMGHSTREREWGAYATTRRKIMIVSAIVDAMVFLILVLATVMLLYTISRPFARIVTKPICKSTRVAAAHD